MKNEDQDSQSPRPRDRRRIRRTVGALVIIVLLIYTGFIIRTVLGS